MIDGTRPYRGKNFLSSTPGTLPCSNQKKNEDGPTEETLTDAMSIEKREQNMDRRAWFRSLVPAMGNGLVELLRASNNLQDELSDHTHKS